MSVSTPSVVLKGFQFSGHAANFAHINQITNIPAGLADKYGEAWLLSSSFSSVSNETSNISFNAYGFFATPQVERVLFSSADAGVLVADKEPSTKAFYALTWMHRGWQEATARLAIYEAMESEEKSAKDLAAQSGLPNPSNNDWGFFDKRLAWMQNLPATNVGIDSFNKNKSRDGWRRDVADWLAEQKAADEDINWPVVEWFNAVEGVRVSKAEVKALRALLANKLWVSVAKEFDKRVQLAGSDVSVIHPIYEEGRFAARKLSKAKEAAAQRETDYHNSLQGVLSVPPHIRALYNYSDGAKRELRPAGVGEEALAHNKHWVRFYDPHFGCELVTLKDGIVPGSFQNDGTFKPSVQGIMIMLCGAGMWFSTPISMIPAGNNLRYPKSESGNRLGKNLAMLALSHPFHRGGVEDSQMLSLQNYLSWLRNIIEPLKKFDLPIFGIGRSTGANLLHEMRFQYPDLFSGLIFMSAQRPSWSPFVVDNVLRMMQNGEYTINPDGILWAILYDYKNIDFEKWRYDPTAWRSHYDWLSDLYNNEMRGRPTDPQWSFANRIDSSQGRDLRDLNLSSGLMVSAGKDQEYPKEAYRYWDGLSLLTGDRHVVNFGSTHNPFSAENSKAVQSVSIDPMHEFLRGILVRNDS